VVSVLAWPSLRRTASMDTPELKLVLVTGSVLILLNAWVWTFYRGGFGHVW
jgi:hypothetical protein